MKLRKTIIITIIMMLASALILSACGKADLYDPVEFADIIAFGIHESILSTEITNEAMILQVRPKSEEFVPELEKTAGEIQKKLDYCRDVAEKRLDLRITQTKVLLEYC